MFLPIKADFVLPRFPILTVLVCLLCAGVFFKQISDWNDFEEAIGRYCELDRSRLEDMVFSRIEELEEYGHCAEMMYTIASARDGDAVIDKIVLEARPLVGFNSEDSRSYIRKMLNEELLQYRRIVPPDPDEGLAYYTESWNPWFMMTSAFAHGDWGHIIFNLVFFIAFAGTVEALIGPVAFVSSIVAISLFTGVFSSVSAYATGNHYWTLGLSGIVMGMMGLYSYLLPRGKIRCWYFFIIIFGSIAVPAWALTLWYVGGDIFALFAYDDHGMVNVMAHVTGGIAGFLFGILFMRKAKHRAHELQADLDGTRFKPDF
jgi:membrane associated rhomboid family serine protease